MGKSSLVALDSNCYSYLIDALSAGREPQADDQLLIEKLALVRIMLYDEWGLYITPTVIEEYERISCIERAALHESWSTVVAQTQPIDPQKIRERTSELLRFHSDRDDCRMVAEAEDAGLRYLLTYDSELIARLGSKAKVKLLRPAEYWLSLNIPKNAKPKTLPHSSNPLVTQEWWRWD